MPRSRPMKQWSQGELNECRQQPEMQGGLPTGSRLGSPLQHLTHCFGCLCPEAGLDGRGGGRTWRFRQDYRGLIARDIMITQRSESVKRLKH